MGNSTLKSLNEIMNNSVFRIPDYQRGYSWGDREREDFWSDLNNLGKDRSHYTGVLTVENIEKKKALKNSSWVEDKWIFDGGYKAYYVIDGQQRLTTISILIKSILDKYDDAEVLNYKSKEKHEEAFLYVPNGKSKTFIFGYEKDDPSDQFFKSKVMGYHTAVS